MTSKVKTAATADAKNRAAKNQSAFGKLMTDEKIAKIPSVGDTVEGKIISMSRYEVWLDIDGIGTGIVRGDELMDESGDYESLKIGDMAKATIMDMDNEKGLLELSFKDAGHRKAWDNLFALRDSGEILSVKVTEANKGGLIVKLGNVRGFLPVSHLMSEHYPKVAGGDKNKILLKLKQIIGEEIKVKVTDVIEAEEKIIVSEKAAWEEARKEEMSKYKIGDIVEGKISALASFGAFLEFNDSMEGLIHISEIAWQRIDNPHQLLKIGDQVKAEIINIDGPKIFLSIKKLIEDPWTHVEDKYKVNQKVKGKVLKINPFGLFVELDPDIHGLAHVTTLSEDGKKATAQVAKIGDEIELYVISIEPKEHRLGLSLIDPAILAKKAEEKAAAKAEEKKEEAKKMEDKTETLIAE